MKKINCVWVFFLISFLLVSCGKEQEDTQETTTEKTDFYVQTTLGSDFSQETTFQKTGKVTSSQDISLNSNATGRVGSIQVKTWDTVYAWQFLAWLQDNIWNYSTNIDRAANSVERAKINYESTKISLDKQVFDAQVNLDTLERNLASLKQTSEQNILLAEDTLKNSKYGDLDSVSALQLEQKDNNIEKAKLDYENKVIADAETIRGYESSLKKDYNSLQFYLDDVIEFSDELLWITDLNRDENNNFQQFLWAKDSSQKSISEKNLLDLIAYRQSPQFTQIDVELQAWDVSQERMLEIISYMNSWYEVTRSLLNNLETTINNSLKSVGQLWDIEINAFLTSVNWYQSQLQSNYGAFLSFGNQVDTFLRTYQNTLTSMKKSIELQEKDRDIQLKNVLSGELSAEAGYEKTLISTDESISNLESQIVVAENNLKNARENRDITLKSLQNSITEAQIGYTSASKDYEKLTITSPINGTISEVFIDVGQEVFSGTELFEIVSDKTPEVQVAFSSKEKGLVREGQKVYIDVGPERITGNIYAISDVADDNLNYNSTVVFASGTNLIGNLVTVEVPVKTDKMLVPINIVTTQWDEIGTVTTLSGSTFSDVRVRMGEVFWDYVEIVSCAKQCEDLKIVTNDVSNFDENNFQIVEK